MTREMNVEPCSKKVKCIMLIDDSDLVNILNSKTIHKYDEHIKIHVFKDALSALEYLKSNEEKPDLIFLDIMMPDLDGWDFLELYRQLLKERNLNLDCDIYMLTALKNSYAINKAKRFWEVEHFLSKPLSNDILERLIRRAPVKSIYIIQNDVVDNFVVSQFLQRYNNTIEIQSFINGTEALKELNSSTTKPDIIFLDDSLPELSIQKFLALYESEKHKSDIYILNEDIELETRKYLQGNKLIKGLLTKPLDKDQLIKTVQNTMPRHIMLVDDDKVSNFVNQNIIKKYCSDIAVSTWESPKQALSYLNDRKNLPDLLLLDITMPEMTGWSFLEIYRTMGLDIKICMLTGTLENYDLNRVKDYLEIKGFLTKPLNDDMIDYILSGH